MKNRFYFILFCCLSVIGVSLNKASIIIQPVDYPSYWPRPIQKMKAINEEEFQLGRLLFYDPILSEDSSVSCASCHLQQTGFTHIDHAVSHGIYDRKGTRNAPALQNLAWNKTFHWDGGVTSLSGQAINPITHPAEMNFDLKGLILRLNRSRKYVALAQTSYKTKIFTTSLLLKALSQFTVSLVTCHSKYDAMKAGKISFSDQEEKGYQLFQKKCASCHTEPLFMKNEFASNGLQIDPEYNDLGRYTITHKNSDSLKFKIPSLRNCEVTFPYMHDGRFKKLKDVINYYSDNSTKKNNHLDQRLRVDLFLNKDEKKDLLAFLYTLTDRTFLANKNYSFPK